jgi:hypothetical protein
MGKSKQELDLRGPYDVITLPVGRKMTSCRYVVACIYSEHSMRAKYWLLFKFVFSIFASYPAARPKTGLKRVCGQQQALFVLPIPRCPPKLPACPPPSVSSTWLPRFQPSQTSLRAALRHDPVG